VSQEYGSGFAFTGGRIHQVVYGIGSDAYVDLEADLGAILARDVVPPVPGRNGCARHRSGHPHCNPGAELRLVVPAGRAVGASGFSRPRGAARRV
jgi:hypothetical protein